MGLRGCDSDRVLKLGSSEQTAKFGQTRSFVKVIVIVASATVYRLEHRCAQSNGVDGGGSPTAFASSEEYAQVTIVKFDVYNLNLQ